jgi:hypothetical protein
MNLTPTQIIAGIIVALILTAIARVLHVRAVRHAMTLTTEQLTAVIEDDLDFGQSSSIYYDELARRAGRAA